MLKTFEKFSFPSIEKRWTEDKETDGKKEKKKEKRRKRKEKKKKKKIKTGSNQLSGGKSL